jgi:hypothetical protein
MATYTPSVRERAGTREATSDPLDFFRGLSLALPISLTLWLALVRGAWWVWRG